MRAFKWLDEHIEEALLFLFYFYIVAIVFIEVVRRYVFNSSSSWGEETAIYAFIWLAYIAAAKAVKERAHLSIDFLDRWKGRRGTLAVNVISDICFFALAAVIFYYSILPIRTQVEFGQQMDGLDLPIALATVAVPVGWLLIMVRIVQRFIRTIVAYGRGEDIRAASHTETESG